MYLVHPSNNLSFAQPCLPPRSLHLVLVAPTTRHQCALLSAIPLHKLPHCHPHLSHPHPALLPSLTPCPRTGRGALDPPRPQGMSLPAPPGERVCWWHRRRGCGWCQTAREALDRLLGGDNGVFIVRVRLGGDGAQGLGDEVNGKKATDVLSAQDLLGPRKEGEHRDSFTLKTQHRGRKRRKSGHESKEETSSTVLKCVTCGYPGCREEMRDQAVGVLRGQREGGMFETGFSKSLLTLIGPFFHQWFSYERILEPERWALRERNAVWRPELEAAEFCDWCKEELPERLRKWAPPGSLADTPLCPKCHGTDLSRCVLMRNFDSYLFYRNVLLARLASCKGLNYESAFKQMTERGDTLMMTAFLYKNRDCMFQCSISGLPIVAGIGGRARNMLHLDHDHLTGAVRFLTLMRCSARNPSILLCSINMAGIPLYELAIKLGLNLLDFWDRVWAYLRRSSMEDMPEDAQEQWKEAIAEVEERFNTPVFKLTSKQHAILLRMAVAKPAVRKHREKLDAHPRISPITGKLMPPDQRAFDHCHQTGMPRYDLENSVNLRFSIKGVAAHLAFAEYDGDDPEVFMPIFFDHLWILLDNLARQMMLLPQEIQRLCQAAAEVPELSRLTREYRSGAVAVSMAAFVEAMEEGGPLEQQEKGLQQFLCAKQMPHEEHRRIYNLSVAKNPMKGVYPSIFDWQGKHIYLSLRQGSTTTALDEINLGESVELVNTDKEILEDIEARLEEN
ncbi:hypothetical protein DFH07DRAFT_768145 [Mycena maculata]|uniref:Uncharacterized protein n=1 Tax=Mycena maculata TaxID=230809 RepID=A0AAD7JUC4_9AGAR|nr:hypothetical protein DFH07DRAFT_768145 [Mycena maculata]